MILNLNNWMPILWIKSLFKMFTLPAIFKEMWVLQYCLQPPAGPVEWSAATYPCSNRIMLGFYYFLSRTNLSNKILFDKMGLQGSTSVLKKTFPHKMAEYLLAISRTLIRRIRVYEYIWMGTCVLIWIQFLEK